MLILGNLDKAAGLADMEITNKLLRILHTNSFSAPLHGCIIALGLMYLKTNQALVAEKLQIPDNAHDLERIPPEIVLLRVLCKNIILWDSVQPTQQWIEDQIPSHLFYIKEQADIAQQQAYENIMSGCYLSLGLRFAGSANESAFNLLLTQMDRLLSKNFIGI